MSLFPEMFYGIRHGFNVFHFFQHNFGNRNFESKAVFLRPKIPSKKDLENNSAAAGSMPSGRGGGRLQLELTCKFDWMRSNSA